MRKYLLVAGVFLAACNSPRLYRGDKQFETGNISPAELQVLRSYLSAKSGIPVRDTIILKYDYNHETCWDLSDGQPEEMIRQRITNINSHHALVRQQRPDVTVLHFRENGKDFNKVIAWDNQILVDSGYLRYQFFKRRAICGSSVLVLPSGKFLLKKSDSHFQMLEIPSAALTLYLK